MSTLSSTTVGFLDGPLSSAKFAYPASITSDGSGNYWVADTGNSAIRFVNVAEDDVITFAGTGKQGYRDGVGISAMFSGPIQAVYNPADGYTYVSTVRTTAYVALVQEM